MSDPRPGAAFDPYDLPYANDVAQPKPAAGPRRKGSTRPGGAPRPPRQRPTRSSASGWRQPRRVLAGAAGAVVLGAVAFGGWRAMTNDASAVATFTSAPVTVPNAAPEAGSRSDTATTRPAKDAAAPAIASTPKPTTQEAEPATTHKPSDPAATESDDSKASVRDSAKAWRDPALVVFDLVDGIGTDPLSGALVEVGSSDDGTGICRYDGPIDDPGVSTFMGTCVAALTGEAETEAVASSVIDALATGGEEKSVTAGAVTLRVDVGRDVLIQVEPNA